MIHRFFVLLLLVACSTTAQPSTVQKLPMLAMSMPLQGVSRGARALDLNVRHSGGSATEPSLQRDEFEERWISCAVGVERQWVFDQEPSGSGDLEVRVELHASNTQAVGRNTEISGASGRWGIGPATWVDALGRHSPVHSRVEDGHLILVVDQGVVMGSAYPAILDPVFTSLEPLRPPELLGNPLVSRVVSDGVDLYTNLGPYNPDGLSTDLPQDFVGCFGPRACLVRRDHNYLPVDPATGAVTGAGLYNSLTPYLTEGGFVVESPRGAVELQYYAADGTPGALVSVHPTRPSELRTYCSSVECVVQADDAYYNVTSAGATPIIPTTTDFTFLLGIPGGGFWASRYEIQPGSGYATVYWRMNGNLEAIGPENTLAGTRYWNTNEGLLLFSGPDDWTLVDATGATYVIPRPDGASNYAAFACPDDCYFFAGTSAYRYDRATETLSSILPFGTDTNQHLAARLDTADGESAALWLDRRDLPPRGTLELSLRAGRLSPSGSWLGEELILPDGDYYSSLQPLVLARAPTAWTVMHGPRLWSFDETGLLYSSAAFLSATVWAAAPNPDGVFLVLHDADRYFLRGVLVSGAATTSDIDLGFADAPNYESAAISRGDDSYLVAVTASGVRGPDLFAVRVTVDGAVLEDVPISLSASDGRPTEIEIVNDGNGWLVFWNDTAEGLSVMRVRYDGTLPATVPTVVHADTHTSRYYAVDFDGSDTWVAHRGDAGVEVLRMRGLDVVARETVPAEGTHLGLAASDAHLLLSLITEFSGARLTHLSSITNDVDGALCTTDDACDSGFCVGGRCCDSLCDGGCEACARANGAETDGVCGPVSSGVICRESTGACDLEETCDGTATLCPPQSAPPAECVDSGVDAGTADGGSDAGPDEDAGAIGWDGGPAMNDASVGADAGLVSDAGTDSSVMDAGMGPADDGGCSIGHGQHRGVMCLFALLALGIARRRRTL